MIAVGAAFVNNVVLSQFLGICPFLGVSKNVKTAAGMGGAVVFVITIASFVTGLIYKFILGNPKILGGELQYLNTIVFILVIAALVQFVEMFLKKVMPPLYNARGVYLPLITTNCAVLGVALTNVQNGYYEKGVGIGLLTGVVNGFATAAGFFVAIVLMAGIREKIEHNNVPEAFKGTPIVLVTAGLMAVEVDEREEAILDVLPGNNCGGCGYAGCSGLAAAIAQGKADVGGCPVGGASVAGKIGEIMGVDASASERKTAFVKCGGTCEKTKSEYEYYGIKDCIMASPDRIDPV